MIDEKQENEFNDDDNDIGGGSVGISNSISHT